MESATVPQATYEKERSSPRLTMTIPIVMRGKDSGGNSVIEKTHTVVVNRRGAKVLSGHLFALGTLLEVAVPHLKRVSPARVVWLGVRDADVQQVGIDLGYAQDFWGLEVAEPQPAAFPRAGHSHGNGSAAKSGSGPQVEKSAKLSTAIEELVQTEIERSLQEILPRVTHESEEHLRAQCRTIIGQAQTQIQQQIDACVRNLETQVADTLAKSDRAWQETLQESVLAAQQQLETALSEQQERLKKMAEGLRRELARKLADLSSTLDS